MANDGDDDDTTSLLSFPKDLIEIILSNLPAKSLFRFKAVSKSWNDLISSPQFIKSHLHRSKINSASQLLFLGKLTRSNYPLLRLGDGRFQTESVLNLPAAFPQCSCNGLLLCEEFHSKDCILWNPSCRKHIRIYYPYYNECGYGAFGLCRDRLTDDVKIVIVNKIYYDVYSCNAKSWRHYASRSGLCVEGVVYRSGLCVDGAVYRSGLCVDGAVYWVWFRQSYKIQYIVCFDSGDDELKTMEKPLGLDDTDLIQLVCFKERLCAWFYNIGTSVVQIWSWNRSCWTKLMTIEDFPTPFHYLKPLYFQENMILIQVDTARFVIYRPIEKAFEKFEDKSMVKIYGIFPYMESLVFVPVQKTSAPQKMRVQIIE